MIRIGPFYICRDTSIPADYPPKAHEELVRRRLEGHDLQIRLQDLEHKYARLIRDFDRHYHSNGLTSGLRLTTGRAKTL